MVPGHLLREEFSATEHYALYRGVREADGSGLLLKVPAPGHLGLATLASLRREHDLLAEIDLPGVPRLRGLEAGGGALALEDIGGVPLHAALADGPMALESTIAIGVQLAATLAELHRRRIIFKNLSPYSVLVDQRSGRAQLFDFSLASRLSQETRTGDPPSLFAARLPYMSPEQTGRMNRVVDYRTDLYSLGATLYRMLTGRPPFLAEDPLELVHWQIARLPLPPSEIAAGVPTPVSAVVMRLLQKTAEQRYQSAAGLRADLQRCAEEWEARHSIPAFPLGLRDVSDRFTLPQQLYGRDAEVETLLRSFERACQGPTTLLLVSGYSGVGKTSLIHEIYKPIVRRRGLLLSGKFDQLDHSAPFGALRQALRAPIQRILAESEDHIAAVQERMRQGLGQNAGVLAAVMPEIELLLGPVPPASPLGPTESQRRFNHAFWSLLQVFVGQGHPLVLFLDDLQWADSASLKLLSLLLTTAGARHLLVIGAYRDNEVGPGHPLLKVLAEVREDAPAALEISEIKLAPLRLPDLVSLVGEATRNPAAAQLARLVLRKTDGNPFFVMQFLQSLHQDGLLGFDHDAGHWSFDVARIEQAQITDNVVVLMAAKLRRLAGPTQRAVTLAACIGNVFTLATLAVLRQRGLREAARELWPAIQEGLIVPIGEGYEALAEAPDELLAQAAPTYRFLHDRVQQAAYALIQADQRRSVHLEVGRLLRRGCGPEIPEDRIFEIVNHLNIGAELLVDEAERLDLCRLNLAACRQAKAAAAFQAALSYAETGRDLLAAQDHWELHYELTWCLHLKAAECQSLCGRFEDAERSQKVLLERARTRLDTARVLDLRILQHEYLCRYTEAIQIGRRGLALFGLSYPESPAAQEAALATELAAIEALVAGRPIEALIDLPLMTDPDVRAIMRLLTSLHTPCYLSSDKTLTLLNTALMVRLSLAHGNLEESALAYVLHAMHIGPIRGDHRSAYEFGMLALRLNERLCNPGLRARILMNFGWAVSLFRVPFSESIGYLREAFQLGCETGLFSDAAYALFDEVHFTLLSGRELSALRALAEADVELLRRVKMHDFVDAPLVILHWGLALQGLTAAPTSLNGDSFDEDAYLRDHRGQGMFEMFYYIAKLGVLYTFGEYQAAHAIAGEAERVIRDFTGTIWEELRIFYHALTLAALQAPGVAPDPPLDATLAAMEARLADWAGNSPANFLAQHRIVAAEIARVRGQDAEATRLYEAAIEAASAQACPRERALAHELYGRFWRSRRQDRLAAVFLSEARLAYTLWGATAKVRELEQRYPDLLGPVRPAAGATAPAFPLQGSETGSDSLDFFTAIKAAHAIAEEIELDKLLKKLVRIAIENAGAERGLLLEARGARLFVVAEGSVSGAGVVVEPSAPVEARRDLCHAIVRLVERTGEGLLVDDAGADPLWATDPYVSEVSPRSILCLPIVHQGKQRGLLYMENNLAARAFTSGRIEVLRIIAAQASIALENAGLYGEMKQEVQRRCQAEQALRGALAEVQALKDRLQAENVYLQEEIRTEHNFEEIIGNSPALLQVLRKVEKVAATDATVLLAGETGTGKELFARAVHSRSPRRARPLVKVNCGAIASGLVESELFGHEKGAFTGALAKRIGRFQLADGGTIFLDEVGEMPLDTQVKLLRALQEREFEPVGSSKTVRVDVRVIAATNRNLDEMVRAGTFRADLLYRLNLFPIQIPPLRARIADIPLLVGSLLSSLSKRLGKPLTRLCPQSMERLMRYSWPGNVRELQNIIERAAILAQGPILELEGDLLVQADAAGAIQSAAAGRQTIDEVERAHILQVLAATGGVIEGPRGAARILDLHPNTLRSRMKKLGIDRSQYSS